MGKAGKIDEKFFKSVILPGSGRARAEVLQGPQFGVDVAVIETNEGMAMLLTSDPLSLIPGLGLEESAWLSVYLMANDMATTSFSPQYMQAVLNLPVGLSDEDFREYWRHIDRFCKEIGTAITGGHTGSVEGQNSTICGGGTMISIAPRDQVLTTPMAKAGDSIFMTSGAAISSASILALSFAQTVTQKLGKETAQNAQGLFYQTSVLPVAGIVNHLNSRQPVVHAMHDVTEGGVWGAVFEMASAANLGVQLHQDSILISDDVKAVCDLFDLPYAGCIGAGSMILAVDPSQENTLQQAFETAGIACAGIGGFTPDPKQKELISGENTGLLPYFDTDPYWAAFFEALNRGWK